MLRFLQKGAIADVKRIFLTGLSLVLFAVFAVSSALAQTTIPLANEGGSSHQGWVDKFHYGSSTELFTMSMRWNDEDLTDERPPRKLRANSGKMKEEDFRFQYRVTKEDPAHVQFRYLPFSTLFSGTETLPNGHYVQGMQKGAAVTEVISVCKDEYGTEVRRRATPSIEEGMMSLVFLDQKSKSKSFQVCNGGERLVAVWPKIEMASSHKFVLLPSNTYGRDIRTQTLDCTEDNKCELGTVFAYRQ